MCTFYLQGPSLKNQLHNLSHHFTSVLTANGCPYMEKRGRGSVWCPAVSTSLSVYSDSDSLTFTHWWEQDVCSSQIQWWFCAHTHFCVWCKNISTHMLASEACCVQWEVSACSVLWAVCWPSLAQIPERSTLFRNLLFVFYIFLYHWRYALVLVTDRKVEFYMCRIFLSHICASSGF